MKNKPQEVKNKNIFSPVIASMKNRGAAYFVDLILFVIIFTGVLYLASFLVGYQDNLNLLEEQYIKYGVYVGNNSGYELCDTTLETCQESLKNFYADDAAIDIYLKTTESMFLMFVVSAAISSLIYEFLIPIFMGNGETIGMKIMKICYVNEENYRVSHIQIFTRFLFGKFLVNLLIPIMGLFYFYISNGSLLALAVVIAIPLINLIMTFKTKNRSGIANTIGKMVVVSKEETFIFESKEAYIAAKCEQERIDADMKKTW